MPTVVFFEAPGRPLSKLYSEHKVINYPLVRDFTSHKFEVAEGLQGLREKADLLLSCGKKGYCMFNGQLTRDLKNESRAGLTDKAANAYNLIIDVDNIVVPSFSANPPFNRMHLQTIAELVIAKLPEPFHKVSYIVHASNSFGLKLPKISMHIEFFLTRPEAPTFVKNFMTWLNFNSDFEPMIGLTPSGMALSWPLDITMAEATRLVYIAPPRIEKPLKDPFDDPGQRIQVVEKELETLDLSQWQEVAMAQATVTLRNKKLAELRKKAGLPTRNQQTQKLKSGGDTLDVITNPDIVTMQLVADEGNFLRYNINGGDSAAYYVYKRSPNIVRNFKGEAPFLLEAASPETYQMIMEEYRSLETEDIFGRRPFAFRDWKQDAIYHGFYDPQENRILEISTRLGSGKSHISDFYTYNGFPEPDILPQVRYVFEPDDPRELDLDNEFVNRFRRSAYLRENATIPEEYRGVGMGSGILVRDLCPLIYKIMHSIVGSDDEEYEYFLNWIAFIVQKRQKAQTAYVLQGVQGTGKGLFFSEIMTPIIGDDYCSLKMLKALDDTSNAWVQEKLFVMIDEVRIADAANASRTTNLIKSMVTDSKMTMRALYSDQKDIKSYTNFLFATNNDDAIEIPDGDRRFNIAPRQTQKLLERHPELALARFELPQLIAKELPYFASFLMQFQINTNAVMEARETESKEIMRLNSQKTTDRFCYALAKGDLQYFLDYMNPEFIIPKDIAIQASYESIVKNAIATLLDKERPGYMPLTHDSIRFLYSRIIGKEISPASTTKFLQLHGLRPRKIRHEGTQRHFFEVTWSAADLDPEELTRQYLTPTDMRQFSVVPVAH